LWLIARSVLARDADAEHYFYEPKPKKEEVAQALTGEALAFHKQLEGALEVCIRVVVAGASLLEFRYAERDEQLWVLAIVRTPQNFTPEQV